MSTTEKKTLVGDFGVEGRNLYENKITRMQCLKIKIQERNMEKNKNTGTSKWVFSKFEWKSMNGSLGSALGLLKK